MGYCKDVLQESLESFLASYWEDRHSDGKPVIYIDFEEMYLGSFEAYQEELADRTAGALDRTPDVKAKIARVLGLRTAKEAGSVQ